MREKLGKECFYKVGKITVCVYADVILKENYDLSKRREHYWSIVFG